MHTMEKNRFPTHEEAQTCIVRRLGDGFCTGKKKKKYYGTVLETSELRLLSESIKSNRKENLEEGLLFL